MPKETKLDASAEIYQKREAVSEKKKFRDLDRKGKWQYFKDYYLVKTLVAAVLAAIVFYIVYTIFFAPRVETILNVAFIDDVLDPEKMDSLEEELQELLAADGKSRNIMIDDSYVGGEANYTTQQKLVTYLFAGMIDIIIGEEEDIRGYAQEGMLLPLADLLPTKEYSGLEDKFLLETRENDTREKAYGVYLKDCENFKRTGSNLENPVIAVVGSSKFVENAVEALLYLAQ